MNSLLTRLLRYSSSAESSTYSDSWTGTTPPKRGVATVKKFRTRARQAKPLDVLFLIDLIGRLKSGDISTWWANTTTQSNAATRDLVVLDRLDRKTFLAPSSSALAKPPSESSQARLKTA